MVRKMYVEKRNGKIEEVKFDEIRDRLKKLGKGLDVNPYEVTTKVCQGIFPGVTTAELDELAAETCAQLISKHPDYGKLAAKITIDNLQKQTDSNFLAVSKKLYDYEMLSEQLYKFICKYHVELENALDYERDFFFDFFGFKTLERSYLIKVDGKICERPQHMFMRVALGIHVEDGMSSNQRWRDEFKDIDFNDAKYDAYENNGKDALKLIIESYDLLSQKYFIHASPTLFNAGTLRPQLSSCFLVAMKDDSIDGIYDTLKQCAMISKWAGGIGLSISNIRATGSRIKGTNGTSNGLVPMLRVFNNTARYVDQGGGKRKGAFAVYLEPWHADIFMFLSLKKNHGKDEVRARDLFYGLWICDLFMERVKANKDWSLMCPHECPGLNETYGKEFEALYTKYEKEGKAKKSVKAREVWKAILSSQIETGVPYMLYKDACNRKSNQKNLGTIKSSNLCTEIIQYTSKDEIAVCNLASLSLKSFVEEGEDGQMFYNHDKLFNVVQIVTNNLNKVLDINYYPVKEAFYSNKKNRPVGIGVQGLADALLMLGLPWESKEAAKVNRDIFETIYFGALTASKNLAKKHGPYASYKDSPISRGEFQFNMWGKDPDSNKKDDAHDIDYVKDAEFFSGRWDWSALREEIKTHGVRNSLLVAPMPTASTSQILGNNECFEPYTSNLYVRRTLSGDFVVFNPHLLRDLMKLGLWNKKVKNDLVRYRGSVQKIKGIPQKIKKLYKTVWEIPQKTLVNLASDRGHFIDQSQSFNVHLRDVDFAKATSYHFYCWEKGLKTGMYYLRSESAVDAIAITVDEIEEEVVQEEKQEDLLISNSFTHENDESFGVDEESFAEEDLDKIKADFEKEYLAYKNKTKKVAPSPIKKRPAAKKNSLDASSSDEESSDEEDEEAIKRAAQERRQKIAKEKKKRLATLDEDICISCGS